MSYADAVKCAGPAQNVEEKRAPILQEIEYNEPISTTSRINVNALSDHPFTPDIGSESTEEDTRVNIKTNDSVAGESYIKDTSQRSSEISETPKKNSQVKDEKSVDYFEENAIDPTYLTNVIPIVIIGLGMGFGAYRKFTIGELSWKEVSIWTGVVGAFAVANFYLTQLFSLNFRGKA